MLETNQQTNDEVSFEAFGFIADYVDGIALIANTKSGQKRFDSAEDLKNNFEKHGMILSFNEAVQLYNTFKPLWVYPELKNGLFSKNYNKWQMQRYSDYCAMVNKVKVIKKNIDTINLIAEHGNFKTAISDFIEVLSSNPLDTDEGIYNFVTTAKADNIDKIYDIISNIHHFNKMDKESFANSVDTIETKVEQSIIDEENVS